MFEKVQQMRQQRELALGEAKAITNLARKESRGLSADEQTKFDALLSEADKLETEIKRDPDAYIPYDDIPIVGQPPHRNGGRSYAALFGANANSDGWRGASEYFRCVTSGAWDGRLRAAGMSGSVGSDGGYLLPGALAADLLGTVLESSVVLSRCDLRPMTTSELRVSGLDDSDHSALFGFSSEWLEEGGEATLQTPKVRSIMLKAKKNILLTSLTNELMEDMQAAAQPKLLDSLAAALRFSTDGALLNGSGAGQPQGALQADSAITVAKEDGQVNGTIVAENLAKMSARLYPPLWNSSVWLCHPSCMVQLLLLQTKIRNDSAEVVGGSESGLISGDGKGGYLLVGRPLVVTEQAQPLGSEGDLALVALGEFVVGLRKEITTERSSHVFFSSDRTALRCITRLDAQSKWASAITPANGSDSLSWCVKLAARSA